MRYPGLTRTHARVIATAGAIGVLCVALARPAEVAQGRVDPQTEQHTSAVLSANEVGIATGGGTIELTVNGVGVVASFGINGKRPTNFVQDGTGTAIGRVNYDKHAQVGARHVNVPVKFMTIELSATPTPNGTGGRAQLIGDCTAPGAECPSNAPAFQSVLVDVQDVSDSGATLDTFTISYCTGAASATPAGCIGTESGPLRTGNIQIRASVAGSSGIAPTAARAPLRKP
jgi:hypothetical protein